MTTQSRLRRALIGLSALSISLSSVSAAGAATYPADTQLTVKPMPSTARPGYLTPTKDPVFGSTVTRVSDAAAFGSSSSYLRNVYAKISAWNSDGSRLLLGYTSPGYLLDGNTYKRLGTVPRAASAVWSSTQPDVLYSVSGNSLLKITASTGAMTTMRTFSGYDSISISLGEGSPSNDDRTLALVGRASGTATAIAYDPVANATIASRSIGATSAVDWVAASQSGRYVLVSYFANGSTQGKGVDLYDRNMNFVRHLYDQSEHADIGYDSAGSEVLVTVDYASGGDKEWIVAVRLGDGVARTMMRTDWVGTHVSCRNVKRPGWCFVSDSDVNRPASAGYNEIYALKLDGSSTVQRFAHAHQTQGVPYDWRTLAVPHPDGSRVLWGSDWGRGTSEPAYAYVAAMDTAAPAPAPSTSTSPAPSPSSPAPSPSSPAPSSSPSTLPVVSPTASPTAPTSSPTPAPTTSAPASPSPTVGGPAPVNLLVNPGFEIDADSNGAPDNWTSSASVRTSTTAAHSGVRSARHASSSDTTYGFAQTISGITAGRSYEMAGWTNIPPTSDSFELNYSVQWLKSSGSLIRTDWIKRHTRSTAGWEQTAATLRAPKGATKAKFRLTTWSYSATAYVDSMSFVAK